MGSQSGRWEASQKNNYKLMQQIQIDFKILADAIANGIS